MVDRGERRRPASAAVVIFLLLTGIARSRPTTSTRPGKATRRPGRPRGPSALQRPQLGARAAASGSLRRPSVASRSRPTARAACGLRPRSFPSRLERGVVPLLRHIAAPVNLGAHVDYSVSQIPGTAEALSGGPSGPGRHQHRGRLAVLLALTTPGRLSRRCDGSGG